MHFSIPDTVEVYNDSSATTPYTAYNIDINGSFHCSLRFKQLHSLHEQLRRLCTENMGIQIPNFPPKRLLPLTNNQLEVRRQALEHYLQLVGQDARISKLPSFQQFLLKAQLETAATASDGADLEANVGKDLTVEITLANGRTLVQVPHCRLDDNASSLLTKSCDFLQLPKEYHQHFCLFLVNLQAGNTLVLLRKLMDFEAPLLSARRSTMPCQIMLRKSYWSNSLDAVLYRNAISLNLLFLQAVSDIQREWIICTPEIMKKLQYLQEQGMKKEYIEMASQLPLYGGVQFAARTIVDYPEPQTSSIVSIGNRELSMRTPKGNKIYETKFRVTRMRCWRVTAIHCNCPSSSEDELLQNDTPANLQLSFEYLMANKSLRWITITSQQAMLMSVCLQDMVDELLHTKSSTEKLVINCNSPSTSLHFLSRNGHIFQAQSTSNQSNNYCSSNSSTPSFSPDDNTPTSSTSSTTSSNTNHSSSSNSSATSLKFLSSSQTTPSNHHHNNHSRNHSSKQNPKIANSISSYGAVFFRNVLASETMENEAFENIGDDDL